MNFYEHHIGDYAEATQHLSFLEDAAYSRLLRKYYATERPLPADVKAVQRLVGARTKKEREAVAVVLDEFFELCDDGWHNARCDEEIEHYLAGEPEREAKRVNEDNRLRRHREERSRLFKILTDAGEHAPWNIKIDELRARVAAVCGDEPETVPATPPETKAREPATAPATPATATQSPVASSHYPVKEKEGEARTQDLSGVRALTPGDACKAMRAAGMAETNPSNPTLLALLEAGITAEELADAARTAVKQGKSMNYALSTAAGRRRDAAAVARDLPATQDVQPQMLSRAGEQTRVNAEAAERLIFGDDQP